MLGFINALPGAVSQGLIWGIMAIGVYITYKILDIADLTVDGSFCTGGAAFVVLFTGGVPLWLALLAAVLAGMLAGLATGLLHTFCGIPAILAGILTQLGLWSVNMAIMGMKATVAINVTTPEMLDKLLVSLRFVQDVAKGARPFWRHPIFVVGLFTVAIIVLLYWFFGREVGAALRSTGSNQNMARAQGINTNFCKVLGLMLSNGLVALSGALLVQFVLTMKKAQLNEKSTLVKTIVTSDLGANIGRSFGLQIEETLTGFKYIGDKINTYEETGDKEFVIGYEESYGYLVGTHARDKDAVVSAMLICQMAAWYKNQGKTLVDALHAVYEKYGYYLDALDSFVLKGKDGAEKIGALMQTFRAGGDQMFAGVERVQDFAKGIGDLPKENVLKFLFTDGSWLAVRPSGTEPKIKVYYSIVDPDKAAAHSRLAALQAQIKEMIGE